MAKVEEGSVEAELIDATKLERKKGESDQEWRGRLRDSVKSFTGEEWNHLSDPAQDWFNAATRAKKAGDDLPDFEAPATKSEDEPEGETTGERQESEVTTKSKGKSKAKAKKEPAKKAAAGTNGSGRRGPRPSFEDDASIKLLVKENPKRGTAAKRFDLYKNGMTVAQAIKAGVTRADLNWDSKHKFISIG